ncbi:hypothetical protein T11_18498 [Trichinella zimbabwensis]|uniref:Uncharacterized protein n=1 Tax=Trichinella zimbabwensis TaxID=268475 RepID=A0A0V1H6Q5_9BILA|nr:hypothetical protein T11_18498 [Trichinella zimbabwensis]
MEDRKEVLNFLTATFLREDVFGLASSAVCHISWSKHGLATFHNLAYLKIEFFDHFPFPNQPDAEFHNHRKRVNSNTMNSVY